MEWLLGLIGIEKGDGLYFLIKLGVVVVLTVLAVAVVNLIYRRAVKHRRERGAGAGYLQLARYFVLAVVYITAISAMLTDFPAFGKIVSSILAGSGIVAVVLSIACQEAIGNICSGVIIICSKPFQVGDIIRYIDKDITGYVEQITLRHTVIRTFENKRLIIPNGVANSCALENSSYSEKRICMMMDFSVTYESDVETAMSIISDVVVIHPSFCDVRTQEDITEGEPPVRVLVNRFDESAIVIRAWVWAENLNDSIHMKSDVLLGVRQRFKSAGIEFAYPHVTVVTKE